MSDTKHGWVSQRADGLRARCGGPGVCATCDTETMHEKMLTGLSGGQYGTLAPTGNTALDQEMYAAGLEKGEENTKHNAAIRAGVPEGWKLVTKKTCYALMHDGAVIATLAGPESQANAAIIARMLAAPSCPTCNDQGAVGNILTAEPCHNCAAPGVSTVEDQAKPNGQNVGQIVDEYIQEYELRGEDEEGRDGVYSPNETERYMIADAISGLLAEPEFIAAIAGMHNAPAAGDALADPALQKLFGEAITGALAFGAQGLNPPPVGHWLEPFWNMARADAAAAAGLALLDHSLLRDVLGYVEDAGPGDVWGAAQSWMSLRDAAIAAVHPAPAAGGALTAAARDVLAERQRQVEVEQYEPDADDNYEQCELAYAAAAYAITPGQIPPLDLWAGLWPWSIEVFKPTDQRRNLVKAGALILAEIERLDRAAIAAQAGGKDGDH